MDVGPTCFRTGPATKSWTRIPQFVPSSKSAKALRHWSAPGKGFCACHHVNPRSEVCLRNMYFCQLLINAVTGQVKTEQNHLSGNATNQELARKTAYRIGSSGSFSIIRL